MRNFSRELDEILNKETGESRLLLHSCCAPCSSYVLEFLREFFEITVFYYNPNISEEIEYRKRADEQKKLIAAYNMHSTQKAHKIEIIEGKYEPECFYQEVKGLESCPEGKERCAKCFALRLRKSAELAAAGGFDYFTTTLTISPLKNAQLLNEIGESMGKEHGVAYLPSDFKKKDGYKRSIELSGQFELYRQDYCGCIFSKAESKRRKAAAEDSSIMHNAGDCVTLI